MAIKRSTTKRQRDRIYAQAKLKPRTEAETQAYQAMIKQQAEEFRHRHAALEQAYAAQASREREDGPDLVNFPTRLPARIFSPNSLEEQIAARTEALYKTQYAPLRFGDDWCPILPVDKRYAERRWSSFWRNLWPWSH